MDTNSTPRTDAVISTWGDAGRRQPRIWTELARTLERDNARLRDAAEKALIFIDRLTFDDRPGPGNSLCRLSHIATWHAENMRAALVQS